MKKSMILAICMINERIEKAVSAINDAVIKLKSEKHTLEERVSTLESENKKLKSETSAVIAKLDEYIVKMERIKKDHGSSNNSDK